LAKRAPEAALVILNLDLTELWQAGQAAGADKSGAALAAFAIVRRVRHDPARIASPRSRDPREWVSKAVLFR